MPNEIQAFACAVVAELGPDYVIHQAAIHNHFDASDLENPGFQRVLHKPSQGLFHIGYSDWKQNRFEIAISRPFDKDRNIIEHGHVIHWVKDESTTSLDPWASMTFALNRKPKHAAAKIKRDITPALEMFYPLYLRCIEQRAIASDNFGARLARLNDKYGFMFSDANTSVKDQQAKSYFKGSAGEKLGTSQLGLTSKYASIDIKNLPVDKIESLLDHLNEWEG